MIIPPSLGRSYSDRVIGSHVFDANDIQRLESPTALINDICLNGLAYYLQGMLSCNYSYGLSSGKCAIFSTYDLVRIRYKASDQNLWRSVGGTQYWTKPVWIIPIHRPRECHWVLAIAYPSEGRIQAYDSLASERGWLQDLKAGR